MNPLKFLEFDDPRDKQAKFSQLAGQKIGLMEKYEPNYKHTSVGASAVQGAIGGALAGGQLAANAGMFNATPNPDAAGTEPYGDRTAPTIKPGPMESQSGAISSAQTPQLQPKWRAGNMSEEQYDKKFGGQSSAGPMAYFSMMQ